MCNKNDPMVKMLSRNEKKWLIQMAEERGLSCEGNKIDLACRIAKSEYERFSNEWIEISNRKG